MERDRYAMALRGIVEVVEVDVMVVMTGREEGGAVGQGRRRGNEVR